jgi:hypothetical protein
MSRILLAGAASLERRVSIRRDAGEETRISRSFIAADRFIGLIYITSRSAPCNG